LWIWPSIGRVQLTCRVLSRTSGRWPSRVASFGHRLPTRHGINAAAADHGLERTRHSRSPLHHAAYFHKAAFPNVDD
jgi:hypothetical protein